MKWSTCTLQTWTGKPKYRRKIMIKLGVDGAMTDVKNTWDILLTTIGGSD